jgi:hypothetical protein
MGSTSATVVSLYGTESADTWFDIHWSPYRLSLSSVSLTAVSNLRPSNFNKLDATLSEYNSMILLFLFIFR